VAERFLEAGCSLITSLTLSALSGVKEGGVLVHFLGGEGGVVTGVRRDVRIGVWAVVVNFELVAQRKVAAVEIAQQQVATMALLLTLAEQQVPASQHGNRLLIYCCHCRRVNSPSPQSWGGGGEGKGMVERGDAEGLEGEEVLWIKEVEVTFAVVGRDWKRFMYLFLRFK
jgi:hypothetical protein